MTGGPEVISAPDTESAVRWRKIRRGLWRGFVRLALYMILLGAFAGGIIKGG